MLGILNPVAVLYKQSVINNRTQNIFIKKKKKEKKSFTCLILYNLRIVISEIGNMKGKEIEHERKEECNSSSNKSVN